MSTCFTQVLCATRVAEGSHIAHVVQPIEDLASTYDDRCVRDTFEIGGELFLGAAARFSGDGIEDGDLLGDQHEVIPHRDSKESDDDRERRIRVLDDVVEEAEDDLLGRVESGLDRADCDATRMFEVAAAAITLLLAMGVLGEPVGLLDHFQLGLRPR